MKIDSLRLKIICVVLCVSNLGFAAPNPPPPQAPVPPGFPIDGGIIALAIFSIAFAYFKIYHKKALK